MINWIARLFRKIANDLILKFDQNDKALKRLIESGSLLKARELATRRAKGRIRPRYYNRKLVQILMRERSMDQALALIDSRKADFADDAGLKLHAAAMIGAGRYSSAIELLVRLVSVDVTAEPLRLIRQVPMSSSVLDRTVIAFQRSPRTEYRKVMHSSHLIDMAMQIGNIDRAMALSMETLNWLIRAKPERIPVLPSISVSDANVALRDFGRLMAPVYPFFLISGTLLGIMREGTILGHDKDIDVGVMTDAARETIEAAVYSSAMFEKDLASTPDLIKVRHINGILIDIFFHYIEDEIVWHGSELHAWDNKKWWIDDLDIFDSVTYCGEKYLIPKDWMLYLTDNYGDWQTPQKNYDASMEAPNRRIRKPMLAKVHWRKAFIKYFHRQETELLLKCFSFYEREFGRDEYLDEVERFMLLERSRRDEWSSGIKISDLTPVSYTTEPIVLS